jgi:hypothetical protein
MKTKNYLALFLFGQLKLFLANLFIIHIDCKVIQKTYISKCTYLERELIL